MICIDIRSHVRKVCLWLVLQAAMLWLASPAYSGAYDDFFIAVKNDNAAVVARLLARGLIPNLVEPERGDTGLILALREDSMEAFKVLLASQDIDIEARAMNGDNALMVAAWKNNKPAVVALLEKGAEVNKPGWTPLHYAAAIGANDIVQLLLDRSAYIDAESPNGTTPLMMAARGGHIHTVKLLHDNGADATLKNAVGMSAIDFAMQGKHADIAEGLAYRVMKQEKERKAKEEALRLAREAAARAVERMIRPEMTLPACTANEEASAFLGESSHSEEPLAACPGNPG